ncbi:MAG: DUF3127 domain-containing protein [Chitinophagaceae bacterium]|nr:MAG: DUF3127 domain-containing protein [Chitinophagaceae bacterium]
MEISGKLVQLLPPQTGAGKNGAWKKQDFIIETGGQFPKKVCIATWGDKIDIGSFRIGDTIEVSFDVESREYNSRWYTDVKAWKVVSKQDGGQQGGDYPAPPPPVDAMSGDDDLPF